jgi:membrane protease YdiL (CAAX protease family)
VPDISLPDLPSIDAVPEILRILIAVGLALLLVILRLDAERFNAAEYNDVDRWGRKPSVVRRFAWYILGVLGILAVLQIHPRAESELYLGLGDRLGAVILGLAYGTIGAAIAASIALIRYQRIRLPPTGQYPMAILNAVSTAFVDEAIFRGLLFGLLITAGIDPNLANLTQAIIYALATRLGAPGRPWYMLLSVFAMGLMGGWLVGITGGIGAAFLGHAITRVAIFLTTGHAGIPKPKGTEVEEVERRHATPKGWQVLDPGEKDKR